MNNLNGPRHSAARLFASGLLLASTGIALAGVHYVNLNSTNATPPYTSWATAATNIQDAVDVASAGDEILVTNGVYAAGGRAVNGVTNRVALDTAIALRSVNGSQFAEIDGGGSFRCVFLTSGAGLSGFTLTHGSASDGGGVCGEAANMVVVSNCVLAGNSAVTGGAAYGVTLNNCLLSSNSSGGVILQNAKAFGGGAAYCFLNNCTLSGNSAGAMVVGAFSAQAYAEGGGAFNCTLNSCVLIGNSAASGVSLPLGSTGIAFAYAHGGGAAGSTLNNCTLSGNSTFAGANAGLGFAYEENYGGGAYSSTLNNCTLSGNYSAGAGGGAGCTLNNCIVYFNTSLNAGTVGANYDPSCTLKYCCTTPQVTNGVGNITNAPLFVDTNGWANLRLQSNSPCINAGKNSYVTNATDLDGNPRIVGGTVDIGAYEYQSPVSQISYAWLEQYGLPINNATDTADPDGDGVDNYHEWLAGTNPTNALSSPAQLAITPSGLPPSGIILTWSTNAVGFNLQFATNPISPSAWVTNSPSPIVIAGQNTVTNPIAGTHRFYRLIH